MNKCETLLILILRLSPFSKKTLSLNHVYSAKLPVGFENPAVDTLPYVRMHIIKFYFILEPDKVQVTKAFKSLKRKTSMEKSELRTRVPKLK